MARAPIDIKKVFILSLLSFAIIEGLLYLAQAFGLAEFVKGGFFITLMLLTVFLSTLFNLGVSVKELKLRDIITMGIVLVVVIILYFLLPYVVPQIYSIIPGSQQIRDNLVKTLSSVAGIGTGVV